MEIMALANEIHTETALWITFPTGGNFHNDYGICYDQWGYQLIDGAKIEQLHKSPLPSFHAFLYFSSYLLSTNYGAVAVVDASGINITEQNRWS